LLKFIKKFYLTFSLLIVTNTGIAEDLTTASGIRLDADWKVWVYQFSQDKLQHSAWGVSHYERNFNLATKLAKQEGMAIDSDVLFAASFLHDIGVFEPYVVDGAEHSKTASDNVEALLSPTGFPMEKIDEVKASIMSHMFYANVGKNYTAQVLHDADTLDFLGSIGAARILSITTRHPWAEDLPSAIATVEKFNQTLPGKLVTDSARRISEVRVKEALAFIESINSESSSGTSL
jgi:uncharacterized protein